MQNLDLSWSAWTPEDIHARADKMKKLAAQRVAEIVSAQPWSFENSVIAFDRAVAENQVLWMPIVALENLHSDKGVRETAHTVNVELSQEMLDIWYSPEIYAVIEKARSLELPPLESRVRDESLITFDRLGFSKPDDVRAEIIALNKKLTELGQEFAKNIVDIQESISLSEADLAGLPASLVERLKKNEDGTHTLTLAYPEYVPFMEHALSDEKRYEAYIKRNQKGGTRNIELIGEILPLRRKLAQLLGYTSFADYQLAVRMAGNGKTAKDFIQELISKVTAGAHADCDTLRDAKRVATNDPEATLNAWDIAYYDRVTAERNFNISDEQLRPYLSLKKAEEAMFALYGELFSITFSQYEGQSWDPQVRLFTINERETGELIGYTALDMFPREGKYGHMAVQPMAWQSTLPDGTITTPFAILMGNFTPPTANTPSLLTHDELTTLFHEFGHVIHAVLAKSKYEATSNVGVRWDFIEAPSQFLENWVWQPEFLKEITEHYETKEQLPDELIAKIIAKKQHLQRFNTCQQAVQSLIDLLLHGDEPIANPVAEYQRIREEVVGIKTPSEAWFLGSFGHFEGYAAGYYGYLWSEVFASDLFTRFKKEGLRNPKTGMDYRKIILESANSREPMELVRNFLGREPSQEAFLENLGISS